jgi:hypothetical protein
MSPRRATCTPSQRASLYTQLLALALLLAMAVLPAAALQDGVARTPPLGWSTWLSFRLNVSESLLRTSADFLASSPLKGAGYEYILLDDGWPTCLKIDSDGHCLEVPPRDKDGRIPVDPNKFPNGFKPITDYVHRKGLKIGIYTGVSNRTCGGYMGSLFHEAVDAAAFADWGFDFVKHDTCSPGFCGVCNDTGRDGTGDDGNCIKRSTTLMSQGLQATGKNILYYIDHGNPTSPQKIYNPFQHGVNPDLPGRRPGHPPLVPGTPAWDDACGWNSLALKPSELGWTWGADVCHMMKSYASSPGSLQLERCHLMYTLLTSALICCSWSADGTTETTRGRAFCQICTIKFASLNTNTADSFTLQICLP